MTLPRLTLIALTLASPAVLADPVPEYEMKAAFLYNFASFTEWPEPIAGNFNLCVFSNDPIGNALSSLEGKPIQNARLSVLRITETAQARQCQLLYWSDSGVVNVRRLLQNVADLPILTVSADGESERAGAMINMTVENNKLAFSVDVEPAHRARLNLSSKMLRLAYRVY
ncbi:uncharacterized protein NMK_2835 [Novimethylophilus kurashikiensis]|uniref:DUF4154 domain-containing protein n=1 Tax=Novimethylophilus kurashikiensis TaxID=1825523 RepID=A0A2R5FAH4_9PROT|nr:YfiR family protein [Novimethylophilus kurashikiensis]GBG15232.1 uncharacterized protein NMK_2835 [Novimethylophilus kurashikiensis]